VQVVNAINKLLAPKFIYLPTGPEELEECAAGFQRRKGLHNVVLAIDGCHIPFRRNRRESMEYRNRKKYDSIILQGTVDYRKRFRNVFVGWPGSAHDARVYKNSEIFRR
jgi:hypothetical protein